MTYKGNTLGKEVNRGLVWLCHQAFLPCDDLTSHVFLGSRCVGDVQTLKELGIPSGRIWAVESDYREYRELYESVKSGEFKLWTDDVVDVVGEHTRSVYLDFCGNLFGEGTTIRRVARRLSAGTVLSITLYLGREQQKCESREDLLLEILRSSTDLHVTLLQEIQYISEGEGMHPTRMGTWTVLFTGKPHAIKPQRLDLTRDRPTVSWPLAKIRESQHNKEIETMAREIGNSGYKGSRKAHQAALKAWETRRARAQKRRQAALKAWETRRAS